jgi:very-short-patch-repair endonuclease
MTAADWEAAGVSPKRLRTLVRSGDLVRMRRGVYASRAAVDIAGAGPRQMHWLQVFSVLVAVGFDAVVSHQSAAFLQGLDLLAVGKGETPPAVTLTRPGTGRRNRAGSEGVVFYAAALPTRYVEKRGAMRLTAVLRTVSDLARTLPFMDAVVVADSALRTHEFTKSEYEHVIKSCSGWPGSGQARKVIEFADRGADSVFESCLRVFLRDWGFDPPETNVTVHGASDDLIVDFLFREQNTIVEADGMLKYKEAEDLHKQFHRDRLLRDAGYKVVHVTWYEAFHQPQVVIDRIHKALAAKSSFLRGNGKGAERVHLVQRRPGEPVDVDAAGPGVLAFWNLRRPEMPAARPKSATAIRLAV